MARLMRGYALTSLENIALWHERDISHSCNERIILPDACILLDYALNLFHGIVAGMKVYPDRMKHNLGLTKGLVFSQRVMLALIDKGLSRQEAYKLVQRNAMKTWQGRKTFLNLLKNDADVTEVLPADGIEAIFDYQFYLRYVDEIFQRLGLTEAQWKKKPAARPTTLAPDSL
jgi:adenylosuccinate lyase